jgi:hypothetical protein
MPASDHDIARFVEKRTASLDRIERYRAIGLMFDMEGDKEGSRDMEAVVEVHEGLRRLQGKAPAPKLGGMDRKGI